MQLNAERTDTCRYNHIEANKIILREKNDLGDALIKGPPEILQTRAWIWDKYSSPAPRHQQMRRF